MKKIWELPGKSPWKETKKNITTLANYDFYFKLLGGKYNWYLVSYFKFSDMIKYMNSSAIKTFHGTNQAGNYMDLCDRRLHLKHNCTKIQNGLKIHKL